MARQNYLVRAVTALAFLVLAGVTPASADFIESCPVATSQIYGFTCANTSNTESGTQLVVNNGQVIAGTTGLTSFNTTNLGPVSPGSVIIGGHYGLGNTNNGLGAATSEAPSLPGTGSMMASAQLGNTVNSTWNAIPFSNGNSTVSDQKFRGDSEIPNLHAVASGTIDQPESPGFGGQTVQANATASFSDLVSISQAQINEVRAITGTNISAETVELSYNVSGNAFASPFVSEMGSGADAFGTFDLSATDVANPILSSNVVGSFEIDTGTDDLLNHTFAVDFTLQPGQIELVSAVLTVSGDATDSGPGPSAGFNADLSDTAAFEGATFFADEAGTIPLPTLQLNSAFGFNYSPVTIASGTGGVPEPSTWAILFVGFAAIGMAHRLPRGAKIVKFRPERMLGLKALRWPIA